MRKSNLKRKAAYWKFPAEIPTNITKGQLAKIVLPEDLTFDYAIPQTWLDQFAGTPQYEQIICSCVTAYPQGSIFGEIVNLLTGEIES